MENFNKNAEDLGWEKMKDLLDIEMPVTPPKKRRFLLLWWPVMGVAVSVAGILFWSFNNTGNNKASHEILRNDSSNLTQTINNETTQKINIKQSDQPETISQQYVAKEMPVNPTVNTIVKKNQTDPRRAQYTPQTQSSNEMSVIENESGLLLISNAGQENSHFLHNENKDIASSPLVKFEIDEFPAISARDINGLSLIQNENSLKNLAITKLKKANPVDFYFNAGVSATGWKSPLTYRVGAGVDFRLNPKWGFRAGLQYAFSKSKASSTGQSDYSYYRQSSIITPGTLTPDTIIMASGVSYNQDEDIFNIIEVASSTLPNTDFNPDSYASQELVGVSNPSGEIFAYIQNGQIYYLNPISSVQTFELLLSVYYQMSNRLKLEAGLTASYLYRVTLGTAEYDTANMVTQNQNFDKIITQPANIGIRKLDVGLSVGGSWLLNKHLSVYGAYRQGLIDYTILNSKKPDLSRNIDLGLRYKF